MKMCSRTLYVAVLLCGVYCHCCHEAEGQACISEPEKHETDDRMILHNSGQAGLMATSSCTVDQPSCYLQGIRCSSDSDCFDAFPNLAVAVGMGKIYPQPTAPICRVNSEEEEGRCSCEENQCVSYSKKFGSNLIFFYCGPCGFVGSQCSSNISCTHEQSECRDSFCRCKKQGEFYEVSYCKIPYIGYETALQIAVIVCIVIATCVLLATIYNASFLRKRFGSLTHLLRSSREENAQQASDHSSVDTPPAYNDVVEPLPTYQDALHMSPVDTNELS